VQPAISADLIPVTEVIFFHLILVRFRHMPAMKTGSFIMNTGNGGISSFECEGKCIPVNWRTKTFNILQDIICDLASPALI
jgi:hypothetical protein